MFFLGNTFARGKHTLDTSPIENNTITSLRISGGVYDTVYLTTSTIEPTSTDIDYKWNYETVLYARFQGSLSASNVNFAVENTDRLRIKRREKNTFNWLFLYEAVIEKPEDFNFVFLDRTARSSTIYEYAIVPVFGSVEGAYVVSSMTTDFEGLFVFENDKYISTRIEVSIDSQQQNKPVAIHAPYGQKYPFVISNGNANYKSGTVSAIFADEDTASCEIDFKGSWKARKRINDILYDNNVKLLKYQDGQMYLVSISSPTISESSNGHESLIMTSFDWTEVADCENEADLYTYGFIDTKDVIGGS